MTLNKEQTWMIECSKDLTKSAIEIINKNSHDCSGTWKAVIENIFQEENHYKIVIGIYGSYPYMEINLENYLKEIGVRI